MELLQLFDKEYKPIPKYIERDNKKNVNELEYYKVVLIYIKDSNNKYLMQKDLERQDYGVTGGHVTYGDTSLETAVKECIEEIGLTLDSSELKLFETLIYDQIHLIVDCYFVKKDIDLNSLVLQETEVEEVKLCSREEIQELIDNNNFTFGNRLPFYDLESLDLNNGFESIVKKIEL